MKGGSMTKLLLEAVFVPALASNQPTSSPDDVTAAPFGPALTPLDMLQRQVEKPIVEPPRCHQSTHSLHTHQVTARFCPGLSSYLPLVSVQV
jgi:hypothetical protein